ncbi:prefoldin subunit 6 [Histoplasma capsulatum var. duboisii H88]|uniref:Prefoldin subunit 6 n=2 Tax=Ajellomyces capsulatus TaxID=5037 RepID=F0U6J6_AJEC8|nr:prefoldin subunit 6 [Histoplasma capsulatum H143]EGC42324.1 prefoldin subunit 6 [Histoplasma capsulatum var. duboisii H88]
MADPQKQLQILSDEYQKLETELQEIVQAREKLEAQQQENKSVQNEFKSLETDANIYKLVGPILLKQDKGDAMMAVDGRLDFIEKEMYVHALYYRFFLGQSEEIGLLPGNFRFSLPLAEYC